MERTVNEDKTAAAVRFLKALADESRLKIVGLLAAQPHSVEELAAALRLTAPTVSHHLARLKPLGLVHMRAEGTTHVYSLDTDTLRALSKNIFAPEGIAAMVQDTSADAWRAKVLRDFMAGGRLKEIPASRKKRVVVLEWLAEQFQPDLAYAEREVNEIIHRHHPDAATLRRELIGYGLMERDNGVYRRVVQPALDRFPEHAATRART
jgi:hypothetical protein